jgi:hypothetical protein
MPLLVLPEWHVWGSGGSRIVSLLIVGCAVVELCLRRRFPVLGVQTVLGSGGVFCTLPRTVCCCRDEMTFDELYTFLAENTIKGFDPAETVRSSGSGHCDVSLDGTVCAVLGGAAEGSICRAGHVCVWCRTVP